MSYPDNHDDLEKKLYEENRRAFRKERKILQNRDRSKYKKSDEKGDAPPLPQPTAAQLSAQILSTLPEGYLVQLPDGEKSIAFLRGSLKKERDLDKNLAVVGDLVYIEKTAPHEAVISAIAPRRSELCRQDNLSRKKKQLIAANVDQLLITASVCHPPLKPPLIDRYLISAEKGGLKPLVMINKIDLLEEEEDPLLAAFLEGWGSSVDIFLVSLETNVGLEPLQEALKGKSTVLSGQSGVGKTSLINRLCQLQLKTQEVVEKTKKGAHTTSLTTLIPLPCGGSIVDTPGIKSFGVWDLTEPEIRHYFSNFEELKKECLFPDCTHIHEKGCRVLKALEENRFSLLRYQSYLSLLESVVEKHRKR